MLLICQICFQLATVFNQDIGSWNVQKVTNFNSMFQDSRFNNGESDSIKNWDVSNVTTFYQMFLRNTAFNQPIGLWNTSVATSMYAMMYGTTAFNQDISSWNVSNVTTFGDAINGFMYLKTALNYSAANYDALLNGWASRPVKPSCILHMGTIKRTTASDAAKAILIGAPNNWIITDGGLV
jgi:surface protein